MICIPDKVSAFRNEADREMFLSADGADSCNRWADGQDSKLPFHLAIVAHLQDGKCVGVGCGGVGVVCWSQTQVNKTSVTHSRHCASQTYL